LEQPSNKRHNLDLKRNLKKEGMKIYERQWFAKDKKN
jgi:hypothetical protein